jgi:hypothetical protein
MKRKEEGGGGGEYHPTDKYDQLTPSSPETAMSSGPRLGLGLNSPAYTHNGDGLQPEREPGTDMDAEHQSPIPPGTHDKRTLSHRVLLAWLPWLNIFPWARASLSPITKFRAYELRRHNARAKAKATPPNANAHARTDSGIGFESMAGSGRVRPRARFEYAHSYETSYDSAQGGHAVVDETPEMALLSPDASLTLRPGTQGLMADSAGPGVRSASASRPRPSGQNIEMAETKGQSARPRPLSDASEDLSLYEGKGYDEDGEA